MRINYTPIKNNSFILFKTWVILSITVIFIIFFTIEVIFRKKKILKNQINFTNICEEEILAQSKLIHQKKQIGVVYLFIRFFTSAQP
nr:heme exporter protein D [Mucilaginibacter sp. X5P1]